MILVLPILPTSKYLYYFIVLFQYWSIVDNVFQSRVTDGSSIRNLIHQLFTKMLNRNMKEKAHRLPPTHTHLLRNWPPRSYSSPLRCLTNSLGLPNSNVSLGLSKYQNSYSCSLFLHRCCANLLCIIPVFTHLLLKQVSRCSTSVFHHHVLVTCWDH